MRRDRVRLWWLLAHVIWHQVLPDSMGDYQHLLRDGGTQKLLLAAPCRRPPHPVYRTTRLRGMSCKLASRSS